MTNVYIYVSEAASNTPLVERETRVESRDYNWVAGIVRTE